MRPTVAARQHPATVYSVTLLQRSKPFMDADAVKNSSLEVTQCYRQTSIAHPSSEVKGGRRRASFSNTPAEDFARLTLPRIFIFAANAELLNRQFAAKHD